MALRVRAVVPTLWRSPVLAHCLEALRREERRTDGVELELVVVAQGEDAVEEVRSRVLAAMGSGAGGRLVQLEQPAGFSRATNLGVAVGTGSADYVATVNDDAVVQEGWLGALVEALETVPKAAAAQGWNLRRDGSLDGTGIAWTDDLQAVQIGYEKRPEETRPRDEVWGVSATAALYRKAALDGLDSEHGVFDQRLESYYEDVDLAVRLRAAGWTALSVGTARALHLGSSTGEGSYATFHTYLNRHLVLSKSLGDEYRQIRRRLLLRDLRDAAKLRRIPAIARAWWRLWQGRAGLRTAAAGATTADQLREWPP